VEITYKLSNGRSRTGFVIPSETFRGKHGSVGTKRMRRGCKQSVESFR